MKILDVSDEIYRELDKPSDLTAIAINFWLRTNIGKLNSLLNTSYSIDSTYEVTPELGEKEKDVFKAIYMVHYYDKKLRAQLGAAGLETVVEVESDGARVRRVNKTELGKVFLQAKKDEQDALNRLITAYKLSLVEPLQVAGDDTVVGEFSNRRATDGRVDE